MGTLATLIPADRLDVPGRAFVTTVTARFPAHPASIGAARRLVTSLCATAHLESLREVAVLLVSEVATNALIHGSGDLTITARAGEDAMRVEIFDHSSARPRVRDASAHDEGGRGLAMVDALATDWGVAPALHGKVVWFLVDGQSG